MTRTAIAFLLACLTVAILWTTCDNLVRPALPSRQIVVYTEDYFNAMGDKKVKAIEALNLPDTTVSKVEVPRRSVVNFIGGILLVTVLFALTTGLVLFFYKLYCRWLCAEPHL